VHKKIKRHSEYISECNL